MRALLGTVDFFDVRSLSRAFEFEADHIALEMLDNARIDPREFPRALQRVMDGADGELATPRRPSLLERAVNRCSTHPLTCRRVESVTAELAEHRYVSVGRGVAESGESFARLLSILRQQHWRFR